MNHFRNRSMSIITEPFRSPYNSKQLENKPSQVQKEQMNDEDFNDAVELANFIGLSPVNRVKRRMSSKVQTFFKTNNLSLLQQKSINSHKIIKNDLTNRQINFFDLKKILQNKKKRLIFQKANKHPNFTQYQLKIQQNINQKRSQSERLFRYTKSSLKKEIFPKNVQIKVKNKLEIQTARLLQKKQKQRVIRNNEIKYHLQKMHKSLLTRSKILKQTFESTIFQNPQNSSLLLKQKITKNKFKICKKIIIPA